MSLETAIQDLRVENTLLRVKVKKMQEALYLIALTKGLAERFPGNMAWEETVWKMIETAEKALED